MATRKKKPPPPSADVVRRNIIQWFYDLNAKGKAPRNVSKVCAGIKIDFGHLGPLVKQHLTLLVDLNYIVRDEVVTKVTTGQTTREQPKILFRIGAKGIEYVEGKSEFSEKERYPGINAIATGGSVILLGDGNVVNTNFRPVYDELGRFRLALVDSTELNDTEKLEASVALETIKDQLAVSQPDKTIVNAAWDKATKICTAGTLLDFATRLGPMIAAIFS
jgi:hypothetical protein